MQVAYGLIQSNEIEDNKNQKLTFNISLHRAKDRDAVATKVLNFDVIKDDAAVKTILKFGGFRGFKADKPQEKEKSAIIEFLKDNPDSTREQIYRGLAQMEFTFVTLDRRLKELKNEQKIENTKYGTYKIKESQSDTQIELL